MQLAPAFIAAFAFNGAIRVKISDSASRVFFMGKFSRVTRRIATTRPDKIKKPATYVTGLLNIELLVSNNAY